MDLVIRQHIIDAPILSIIEFINVNSKGKYFSKSKVDEKEDYISVQCPFHKDGKEEHPSCSIYTNKTSNEIVYGTYHCFTCGAKGSLVSLVSYTLGCSVSQAENLLISKFSGTIRAKGIDELIDGRIDLSTTVKKDVISESILEKYNQYHPYMSERKLTPEVIRTFKVGYNSEKKCLTFPIWDVSGNLCMITERSVERKRFYIPHCKNKPVYLLNYIKDNSITEVTVVESQLDALTLWSWGIPAIALLGTGSKYQYELLKKSGIRVYHLAFDGDSAGRKGAEKFVRNMPSWVFTDVVAIPDGMDVNDCTEEQYKNLKISCI